MQAMLDFGCWFPCSLSIANPLFLFICLTNTTLAFFYSQTGDVNNLLMFTWFQAKIDRTTRILFLHLQNPTSLFPSSVLQAAMVSCLSWLQSLGNGERYTEWIERLSQLSRGQWKQHATEENSNASSSVGSVFSRMVISNEDKKLEQFRQEMTSVESAVQSLV